MTEPQDPRSKDDITPEWLDATLRANGHLDGTRVTNVDVADLGVGRGFISQTVRITPTYEGPSGSAPTSLVGKIPAFIDWPDWFDQLQGQWIEAEANWYRHASPDTAIRVPKSYGVCHTSREAYAILLEDLGHLTSLDQSESCSPQQADMIVRALAKEHARWWETDALREATWSPSVEQQVQTITPIIQAGWDLFADRFGARVDPDFLPVGERLARDFATIFPRGATSASTLIHGDYRLENFLFGEPGSPDEVVVLDWQLTGVGSGGRDLAYFISQSLDVPARREIEDHLVALYHRSLTELGVSNYSLEQCTDDYRLGLLAAMFIPILGTRGLHDLVPPASDAPPADRDAYDQVVAAGEAIVALMSERCISAIMDSRAGDLLDP